MGYSVYARLGFNSSNPIANSMVEPLSANVLSQMEMMPPWMNEWQTKDVAEANTGGYFQNPLVNTMINVGTVANTRLHIANGSHISGSTNTITTLLANTKNVSHTLTYSNTELEIVSEIETFTYFTNRLSNVTPMDQNITLPHYQTAIGFGKMMMYLTNQSDNVQNNSPMTGSFTSLYSGNTLDSAVVNTASLLVTLNNSITIGTTTGTDANGNPITITTYSSNISLADAQKLCNNMYGILNTMQSCITNDTTFFQNSSLVLNDYNIVAQFKAMGQTENQLIMEKIGSPKLLERLNSANN
jgi:hypothetical protein